MSVLEMERILDSVFMELHRLYRLYIPSGWHYLPQHREWRKRYDSDGSNQYMVARFNLPVDDSMDFPWQWEVDGSTGFSETLLVAMSTAEQQRSK